MSSSDFSNPNFFGFSTNSVDSKGRVFVPTKWRGKISESVMLHIGLGREGEGRYLELTNIEIFQKLIDRVTKLSATNRRYEALKRNLFGKTEEITLDKQYRILLPKHLIEYAELDDEIIMIGSGDHIQLWNPNIYRNVDESYSHNDFCDDLQKLDHDLDLTSVDGGTIHG